IYSVNGLDTQTDLDIETAPDIEASENLEEIIVDEAGAMPAADPVVPSEAAAQGWENPQPTEVPMVSDEELTYAPDVEVEKSVYLKEIEKKDCNCEYSYLMPYKDRRGNWGFTFAIGASQYTPTYYKPDFVVNETYESYYGNTEAPLVEATLGLKWNNFLGSLTAELGGGYYFNNSKNADDNANLVLIPVRAGLTLALDTVFKEPYLVPYGTVGAYTVI